MRENIQDLVSQKKGRFIINKNNNQFIYENNCIYLDGFKKQTKAEVKGLNLKCIDLNLLTDMFILVHESAIESATQLNSFNDMMIEVKVSNLFCNLYGEQDLNEKSKKELISKLYDFNGLEGHMGNNEFVILAVLSYKQEKDTIEFISPYFEKILNNLYKERK